MVNDKELIKKLRKQLKESRAAHAGLVAQYDEVIASLKVDIEDLRKAFNLVHGHLLCQIQALLQRRFGNYPLTSVVRDNIQILAKLDSHKIEWPKDKE